MLIGLFSFLFVVGRFLGAWLIKIVLSPFLVSVRHSFLRIQVKRVFLLPEMSITADLRIKAEAAPGMQSAIFTLVNDDIAQECAELVVQARRDTPLGKWRQTVHSSVEAEVGNQVAYGKIEEAKYTWSNRLKWTIYLGEGQPRMKGILAAGATFAITEDDEKTCVLSSIDDFKRYLKYGEDTVCFAISSDDLLRWQKHRRTVTRILSMRVMNTDPTRVMPHGCKQLS
jgi:hypothetical protein